MSTKTVKSSITNNPVKKGESSSKTPSPPNFAFTKENYRLMLVGIGLILSGFMIMSLDNEPHGFGFLGLTLGPIVVVSGFMFEFFAIFYKGKAKDNNS